MASISQTQRELHTSGVSSSLNADTNLATAQGRFIRASCIPRQVRTPCTHHLTLSLPILGKLTDTKQYMTWCA